ncbi:MAG: cytochrome C [Meiothermus sp.]
MPRPKATTGKAQYSQNCAGCHGANLQGGAGPALKGSSFTAKWANGSKTVDDLYYIIHTQMPLNAPGSLKESQYLAITAYILQQNGYKAGKTALSSKNLKSIKLTKPM